MTDTTPQPPNPSSEPMDFARALQNFVNDLAQAPTEQVAAIAANSIHAWLTQATGVMFALGELEKRKLLTPPLKSLFMLLQQFQTPQPMAFAAPAETFNQQALIQALADIANGKQHLNPGSIKSAICNPTPQPKTDAKVVSLFGGNDTRH